MAKYIFVTGGVVSSIGKGVTASAMAQLLKSAGLKVFMQKFDPYINVDASHISPFEHGEIFITEDGAMTDLDLGHYERFIDENLNRHSSVTMGRIYQAVINKERNDEYQGTTVQVIPHITNQIKKKLLDVAKYTNADVVITEIGGTVGDIESTPFLEAIRQARIDFGYENTVFIHNTLIPYLKAANEIKTKPTQHSVNALRSLGIIPDVLVLRSERKIDEGLRAKLALYCDVHQEAIFESLDVSIIYEIIVNLHHQGIDSYLLKRLDFKSSSNDIAPWKELIRRIRLIKDEITIAIMGQYVSINDAYLSIIESLKHAGYECGVKIRIKWLDHSVQDMASIKAELTGVSGIIIAGERHDVKVLGMLLLIQYARLNDIPFFGLSLGMELALLEYAMHEIKDFDVITMFKNEALTKMVNLERKLGAQACEFQEDTRIAALYGTTKIKERFSLIREYSRQFLDLFKNTGLLITGYEAETKLPVTLELKSHSHFLAVVYHPEFKSRPLKPHPLFLNFVKCAKEKAD